MNKQVALCDVFPLIEEQLDSGGRATFKIRGTSMIPFLHDMVDSVTVVRPETAPKKYDIIFYRRENGDFILHRIVGTKNGDYICRGDNQYANEYPVKANQIIAIVSEYERKGKRKSAKSFFHKLYSRIWVNSAFIRKLFDKKGDL